MKKISHVVLTIMVFFLSCSTGRNSYVNSDITIDELKYHVQFLASDSLRGRASGSEGNNIAAKYVADEFQSYGLLPKGDEGSYYQAFEVVAEVKAGEKNILSTGGQTFESGKDFQPLVFSMDAAVEGQVVSMGYGIATEDYNDYKGVDVVGKIALVMRGSPEADNPHSKFYHESATRRKAAVAAEKGAVGLLVYSATEEDDELIPLNYDNTSSNYGIPVFSIRRNIALQLLGMNLEKLAGYQNRLNAKSPFSFVTPSSVKMQSQVEFVRKKTNNVIGYLQGADDNLKNEIIVVGAHFDHLGMGGGTSLYRGEPAVHNGADDNASGTAAILEIAQKLASAKTQLKRSVVVIGFSGEEMGLLGSKNFVEHPTVDLKSVAAMFNFDMVGRLRDKKLIINGIGTSPGFRNLVSSMIDTSQIEPVLKDDGNGPSDYAEFYRKDIPVIAFFTNTHEDYHKPTDDADKINYEGEVAIATLGYRLITALAADTARPAFTRVQSTESRGGMGFKVSLGIIPNYADDADGLKVDGVNPGGAGNKAGLQKGDIITKLGDRVIKNVYDYTYALGELKAGDKVDIMIKRNGQEMKLQAVMQKSKRMN
ncbi:M20/M25/M40 family metallo-hydrolase [bacterium]|nr:M20/M25/M40 family metallo-hydrolase [bacterium]